MWAIADYAKDPGKEAGMSSPKHDIYFLCDTQYLVNWCKNENIRAEQSRPDNVYFDKLKRKYDYTSQQAPPPPLLKRNN